MTESKTTPNPTHEAVTLERLAGHVALVTLNRPEARNAVNQAVASALDAIVQETEEDPDIWVVVLTGAGSVFCAGADLKEAAAGRGAGLFTERGGFAGLAFAQRSKPWIAAVNGSALAGGCELALSCDLVVAAEDSAFGLPEVKRGLVAIAGGCYRLPRAIPRNLALEMVMTADPIDARRAQAHGLVNHLSSTGRVVPDALALAGRITRNAPVAVRESLRLMRATWDHSEEELRALSKAAGERVRKSEDYKEGPLAFIEKREPRWTGR